MRQGGLREWLNWEIHKTGIAPRLNWRREKEFRPATPMPEAPPLLPTQPSAPKKRTDPGRPDPMESVDGAVARLEKIEQISLQSDDADRSDP